MPLVVTYEAMNLMISFATLIVAVIAIGISVNKKK
ncbi:putative holin-like toxin [Mesobacillus foraminis]|nr:putative holin-like toxin [Mesobacillus foraminis]